MQSSIKSQKFVTAVIVAAGNSTRMGLDISKQFVELSGKTVIERTLSAFEKSETITETVVVCRLQDMQQIKDLIEANSFKKVKAVVKGGGTRGESVANGVKAASEQTEFFAVHDGARPLVLPSDIDAVVKRTFECGAATLGVPVVDTIKIVNDKNVIVSTPDRSSMFAVQTPQVFEKKLYLSALENAEKNNLSFTDDCQLVERMGNSVEIVNGSYENIKITTKTDILTANAILQNREE